ncbi:uncharacterized protein AC631_04798, partial [Debaryomyces fabryi]
MEAVISSHRPTQSPEVDPSTLSNYTNFDVKETDLQFKVLFDEEKVDGVVVFDLLSLNETEEVVLDTSYLEIHNVRVNEKEISEYQVKDRAEPLGSALVIKYAFKKNASVKLEIKFSTTSKCTALQFLSKEATDGKKAPYLFSQCQAIHARSLFPCFDTPA